MRDFDILAFSVSFEWDYTNVLTMLRLAGIPARAEQRTHHDPLVMIGGAVTFVNPEPLALFADVIAAGEGEALIPPLLDAFKAASDRDDLLLRLAQARGYYVPVVLRRPLPRVGIDRALRAEGRHRRAGGGAQGGAQDHRGRRSAGDDDLHARHRVRLALPRRGGARLRQPVPLLLGGLQLPAGALVSRRSASCSSPRRRGPIRNRAGLVSIALCDHPDIEEILTRLAAMGYSISPASLRLDDLTPTLLNLLRASGERTVTIAPEVGSDRLRRVVNKTVTNDEILAATELIFASGMENLKLYYMIGIPTETDDDLVAIRDQVLQMRDIMMRHAKGRGHVGRIVGSVNPLVPKPGTAYQWLPMEDDASIDRKIKRLRALTADIENVYFNIKSERHSFYQALLSLGDRRVAPAIEAAERNGGNWRAAVTEAGVDADFFVFRDRSDDPVLPWDIIDGGMKDSFFRAEFDKARREEWTLPPKRQKENARLLTVLS